MSKKTRRAIIYAAGVGARLGDAAAGLPKVLLAFGGRSLLARHIEILGACGVGDIVVVTGFGAEAIEAELAALGHGPKVRTVYNPDFRRGSVTSQWAARASLAEGGGVVLMDADVLYDPRILHRLIGSADENCFLLDRDIEPGDEPVKLCIKDGHVVDFRKQPERAHDWHGESVGFFKLAEATARRLVEATRAYIESGRLDEYYDEPLRDLLIADPPGRFAYADISGLPWTEIDFPEDVLRARAEVLPRIEKAQDP